MASITMDRGTELISATEAARHLATLLKSFHARTASKYYVARNNTIEAVILPIEEYEKLVDLQEELDHLLLAAEIRERERRDTGKRITLAELDSKYGLEG